jgi:hypothetical protein
VDDLRILEADEGFCRILRRIEFKGLPGKDRRETEKRWRKEKHRSVPSPSVIFRYLSAFHSDCVRTGGTAVIPSLTELLSAFECINADLLSAVYTQHPLSCATLIETEKRDALFSCKGFKAYQPLNTCWAEYGLILHTEFRDGNVPAGHEQPSLSMPFLFSPKG